MKTNTITAIMVIGVLAACFAACSKSEAPTPKIAERTETPTPPKQQPTVTPLEQKAIPDQRVGAPSGNVVVATAYYQDKLSQCGDSFITKLTFSDRSGSRLAELKGVKYKTSPISLSQADRLNGLEDAFDSWIEPTAVRETSGSARGDWGAWRDVKIVFPFRFIKANGNWNATIRSAEIYGFMEKYPCDDVPGHPARLAREQAEEAQIAQARQVSAVSFKSGPVRDFSGYGTQSISVTDASVTGIDGLPDTAVAFIDAQFFSKFAADNLDGPGIWLSARRPYNPGGAWGFRFRGPSAEANRDACYEAIAASYERWRARFPTLAKLPPLTKTAPIKAESAKAPESLSLSAREKAILDNLRQLGAAADQFVYDNQHKGPDALNAVKLENLVGSDKYIVKLTPVDGEDYSKLDLRKGFSSWKIVSRSGITVTYDRDR